jgi:hypothetical protein
MAWLHEEPAIPGFKHEFLVRLSLSARLSEEELLSQLDQYEQKLKSKLAALESDRKEQFLAFARDRKERFLWDMTFENGIMYFRNELAWVEKIREQMQAR